MIVWHHQRHWPPASQLNFPFDKAQFDVMHHTDVIRLFILEATDHTLHKQCPSASARLWAGCRQQQTFGMFTSAVCSASLRETIDVSSIDTRALPAPPLHQYQLKPLAN